MVAGCGADTPRPLVSVGNRSSPVNGDRMTVRMDTQRLHSMARGMAVNLVTLVPSGVPLTVLPVCLLLHGRGQNAEGLVGDLGLSSLLTVALHAGVRPFALVVPDGGDTYWIAGRADDDPQRMLTVELPEWLSRLGLTASAGRPVTALGISMGSFGALVYARSRVRSPLAAAGVASPALFSTWGDAEIRHVFRDKAQWSQLEPLRHLDSLPPATTLGVWCGRRDPFYRAATKLVNGTHPAVASFTGGAHNNDYWKSVLPDMLRFVGDHLPR